MTENERVKELRKSLGLTLDKFGQRIGVGKSAISDIENGRRPLTKQNRLSICREFNVREEWLRTGEGDMTAARSVSDEIEGFLSDIKTDDQDFRARLVSVLARLSPEEWGLLESMAIKLANSATGQPEAETADHLHEATEMVERDEEIEAEVEDFRREKYKEKAELRQAGNSAGVKTG